MPVYDPSQPRTRTGRAKPRELEHKEQCNLFQWARLKPVLRQYPALDLLSCSLNGVKLSKAQAAKAKAAGMLKGEHDIKLPVARGGFIGLSIELKVGDNKPTAEQLWYGERLAAEGWAVAYCWSWSAAQARIIEYLQQPKTRLGETHASEPDPAIHAEP